MVILEVRSIETCPEALLLFLFFILACCTYTYSLSHRPLHPKGLSRPAALKYHTYEFCRPKQNSLFFFFLTLCYSTCAILFHSTLSENLNPLYYTYHLPTFLIPHSSLHLQRNQSSSLFPSPNPSPFFPFSPPGWPFQGGRGKLKTELKRERENSQVPLSTLPTLPLTLQTRALHVGPPLVRNRHSSEGSAMPQDKMAARANRKRKSIQ